MLVTCCLLHPGHIKTLYRTLEHLQPWKGENVYFTVTDLTVSSSLTPLFQHFCQSHNLPPLSSKLNCTLINVQKTCNNTKDIFQKLWNVERHGCSLSPAYPQITPNPSHSIWLCFLHLIDQIFAISFFMNKKTWPFFSVFCNKALSDTDNTYTWSDRSTRINVCVELVMLHS